jgi:hypothetical protein
MEGSDGAYTEVAAPHSGLIKAAAGHQNESPSF